MRLGLPIVVLAVGCAFLTACTAIVDIGELARREPDAEEVEGTADSDRGTDSDDNGRLDVSEEVDDEVDSNLDATTDADGHADGSEHVEYAEADGGEVPGFCTGQPSFTPCTLLTVPDRSYDICVDGLCVSPGCGDADCNPPGPSFVLPDTNQRQCFNGSTSLVCPGTAGSLACASTSFCGQDAQYGWDAGHDASSRFTRSGAMEPVVTDNVTELVWQGCPAGLSGDLCGAGTADTPTWGEAVSYCDTVTWAGVSDWRLPTWAELLSLRYFGLTAEPALDSVAFPGTPASVFWSVSSQAGATENAWIVGFWDFSLLDNASKSSNVAVRCVRGGGSPPGPRFTIAEPVAGQLIITDSYTGLAWQRCAGGITGVLCDGGSATSRTWEEALSDCESMTWGGYNDWRLPQINELLTIVDDRRAGTAIDTTIFPASPVAYIWSSTTYVHRPDNAWAVDWYSGSGRAVQAGKTASGCSACMARCVRDGP